MLKRNINIGIFGDSFAEDFILVKDTIHKLDICKSQKGNNNLYHAISNKIPAWWDILKDKGYNIDTSMAKGGSDIYFSFTNFLENHMKFDRNIFVVTQAKRISVPYKRRPDDENFNWVHATNAEVCLKRIKEYKEIKDLIGIEISQGLFEYHTKVNYHEANRDYLFASLMIEHIQKIRPDTIFINAFQAHSNLLDTIPKTATLFDIHLLENEKMGVSEIYPTWNGKIDMRKAHLTPESSKILGKDVSRALKTKDVKWLDFNLEKYEKVNPKQEDWLIHESEIIPWIKDRLNIDINKFMC